MITTNNTYTRLVLVLTLVIVGIITAVGTITYVGSRAMFERELSEPQHQLLAIDASRIESMLREVDYLALRAVLHPNTIHFIRNPVQGHYDNISSLGKVLNDMVIHPAVDSMYVYHVSQNSIVASQPFGFFSNFDIFVDKQWREELDLQEVKAHIPLIKQRSVQRMRGVEEVITLYRPVLLQGDVRGVLVVNLDSAHLFSNLNPDFVSELERLRMVVDRDGQVLYRNSQAFSSSEVAALVGNPEEPSFTEIRYEGHSYLLSRVHSPFTDWTFISLIPVDNLLRPVASLRWIIAAISFVSILVGLISILIYNNRTLKPVRHILNAITEMEKKKDHPDIAYIENFTKRILKDFSSLSHQLQVSGQELQKRYLEDLYRGVYNAYEINVHNVRYFHSSQLPMRVIVLSIDQYGEWARAYNDQDLSLFRFSLNKIAEEFLEKEWKATSVPMGPEHVAVLVYDTSGLEDQEFPLRKTMEELIVYLSRTMRLRVSAGISAVCQDPARLHLFYNQALEAVSWRLYEGYGSILFFTAVENAGGDAPVPPSLETSGIVEAIGNGSSEYADRLIEKWVQDVEIRLPRPKALWHQLEQLLLELRNMADQLSVEQPQQSHPLFPVHVHTLQIRDIETRMKALSASLASTFLTRQEDKDFELVSRMIQFMKKRYADNIGLQDVADSVQVGISQASTLFKNKMNDTIYGYLTRMRIEKAEQLLLESDILIAEIAASVGYQNENSFIRSFRKIKQITPGKYRDIMKRR